MPRIDKLPYFDKTYTITSSGTQSLDTLGIDTSRVERIEFSSLASNGTVDSSSYYSDNTDRFRVWMNANGALRCHLGTTYPERPAKVRIRVYLKD